jgi:transcriptional regulator with PAS, ATPase and Fis domain
VVEPTALPMSLFESELFGHARGAYTGATVAASGAFEAANGGTLFLDEIGDLPLPLQVKLLRAVEAKAIRRVGDVREIQLDVRLITATNRDLEAAVRAGAFRDDLYHRLNEIRLVIPPLRERRQDVLPLLRSFVAGLRLEGDGELTIEPAAAALLTEHAWPGNVRELRTLARRLVERGAPPLITEAALIPILPARIDRGYESDGDPEQRIRVFKRRVYLEELARHSYDIRAAARALGVPYATLRSRLAAIDLLEVIRARRREIDSRAG